MIENVITHNVLYSVAHIVICLGINKKTLHIPMKRFQNQLML